jgi:hypothetical protein
MEGLKLARIRLMKKHASTYCLPFIISALLFSSSSFAENLAEKDWQVLYTILHSKQSSTAHDRHELYQTLHWSHLCEEGFRSGSFDAQKRTGITQYPLSPSQLLLQVSCGLGAYQGSFSYYFIDFNKKQVHPVPFKTVDFDEKNQVITDKTNELSGEVTFDNGKLIVFAKARGAGGCGSQITYGFKDGQSYIIEARGQSCNTPIDGAGKLADPANWPLLHVS